MDAPLLCLNLFGGSPSSHLRYGGTGRRPKSRIGVHRRGLEQLVTATRGLRDRRALGEIKGHKEIDSYVGLGPSASGGGPEGGGPPKK